MVDAGSEGLSLGRRILIIAVGHIGSSGLVVNVGRLGWLLAHQRRTAEVPVDNFPLDQFLQREQVIVLQRWTVY